MASYQPAQVIPQDTKDFTYFTDINFQYAVSGDYSETKKNINVINQQIFYLLTTIKGSREFEPTFGSKVPSILFEPCDALSGTLLEMATIEALGAWMPRLRISVKDTKFTPTDDNAFLGVVTYVIKDLNIRSSMTFKIPLMNS